jgi:hypothetical protein
MIRTLSLAQRRQNPISGPSPCDHRTVSKDGRIICRKIVEGNNGISPDLCRTCPVRAVNCAHLRFSLRQTSPSPLIVRFNGRTEVWDDDPPEICFRQAACASQVLPIESPRACAICALRQPVQAPAAQPAPQRQAAQPGKVVSFPQQEPVAATA